MKVFALSVVVFGAMLTLDSTQQPAQAQNLLGPVFTPHLYGMRPPRADTARIRQRTTRTRPPRGYRSWGQYYAAQGRYTSCMNERPGNSASYCASRGY